MRWIVVLGIWATVACDDGATLELDGAPPVDGAMDVGERPPVDAGGSDALMFDTGVADLGADSAAPDAGLPDADAPDCGTERVQEDLAIPTSDGQLLAAFVDRPADPDCPTPTILIQTPYDMENVRTGFLGDDRASRPLFASPHYSFVAIDWRGRFANSDLPDANSGPRRALDSYEIVEWIAQQSWSDGQVGTWGVSALCGAQYRTAAQTPPSLKAMVPIMCSIRTSYDQVYFGGVLRHEWTYGLDLLGFGLRSLYESHPRRDALWRIAEMAIDPADIEVPALVISGWWDILPRFTVAAWQEMVDGSLPAVREQHRLLIGPWLHFASGGEQTAGSGRTLTPQEQMFQDPDRIIDQASLDFFDLHLRAVDGPAGGWAPVRYFQVGEGWREAQTWPPANVERRTLELQPDLSLTLPIAAPAATLDFPYDPLDPSPTMGGSTLSPYNFLVERPLQNPLPHGPHSQAALLERGDQRTFTTTPLDAPMRLVGRLRAHLTVSTTGADTDVAIRILDVGPDGDPLLIGEGIQRLSARDNDESFSEVVPGTPYDIVVGLVADYGYTLPAGHRLGIMISGSNWPLFARNPNSGAPFLADDAARGTPARLKGEAQAVVNTLHLGGGRSHIEFTAAR